VREFCEAAFGHLGLDWQRYVVVDPALTRPAEVDHLVGDAGKAEQTLGWKPSISFAQWVELMVEADLKALQND
jgi:GDPmannose 4,6-dehydratase